MINIRNQLTLFLITVLLSGCSCEKTKHLTEEETPLENYAPVEIIDPFIDSELVEEQNPNTEPDPAAATIETNSTKKVAKKIAKYDTYPDSSYTDLEFTEYDSGLKYQILREGPAGSETPKRGETLVTHYICWHNQNGKPGQMVDNTYERGETFEFKIGYGYVIRGWDDALMDMRVGDKRRLYIPSEMAFGQAGATELVPGDTDLIYEIELVEIK